LLASIVATCKLNNADPVAYISETLQTILSGYPQSQIEASCPGASTKPPQVTA
jgi:transposase